MFFAIISFFLITTLEESLRVFQVVAFLISVTKKYGIIPDKYFLHKFIALRAGNFGEISLKKVNFGAKKYFPVRQKVSLSFKISEPGVIEREFLQRQIDHLVRINRVLPFNQKKLEYFSKTLYSKYIATSFLIY